MEKMSSKRKSHQADLEETDTPKKIKSKQKSNKTEVLPTEWKQEPDTPKKLKTKQKNKLNKTNKEIGEKDNEQPVVKTEILLEESNLWEHGEDEEENLVASHEINDPVSKPVFEVWPREDLLTLFDRLMKETPKNDKLRFKSRLNRINWDHIAFGVYTPDKCRAMWDYVQKHIRNFLTLKDILSYAKEWADHPWKNSRVKSQRHPEMPRRPLTSYMLYYMHHKNKILSEQPQIDMPTLSKLIAEKYKNLSPKKKNVYTKLAAKARDEYNEKLKEFYQNHPEMQSQRRGVEQGPKKPFRLYFEHAVENNQDETKDKQAILEKCKLKWRKMSDKNKLFWINKALEQTTNGNDEFQVDFKKKLQNLLTKEERLLKRKMAGKPDKPPASAYRLFAQRYCEAHPEVLKLPTKDRITLISQEWKSCDGQTKAKYKDELKVLVDQYDKDYQQYLESLTPEDRLDEQLIAEAQRPKKPPQKPKPPSEATSSKQPEKENDMFVVPEPQLFLGEPEPPPQSAFILYAAKKIKKDERPYTEQELQALWDNLSDTAKCKYDRKFKEIKTVYIANYEKFLKSLSKEDLVKFANLKQPQIKDGKGSSQVHPDDEDSSSSESSSDSEDSGHDSTSEDKVSKEDSSTDSDSSSD